MERTIYPIYKKGKEEYSNEVFIVRFDSERSCEILFSTDIAYPEGHFLANATPHHNDAWKDIKFNKALGLYDTQPVARMKGSSMIIDFYTFDEGIISDYVPFTCPKPLWLIEEYRKKFLSYSERA